MSNNNCIQQPVDSSPPPYNDTQRTDKQNVTEGDVSVRSNIQSQEKRESYKSLDGLRAYSAIGIAMMHIEANMNCEWSDNFITNNLIPIFTDFVYLFMIISAFGMCCGYYDKTKQGKMIPNIFYSKRYKRLLPFFALLVMINVIMDHNVNAIYEGFADLTMCFNLLPNPDIKVIGVGWYLGLVFLFYMLFPFFVFLIDNKKRAWMTMIVSLLLCYSCINYFFTSDFVDFNVGRVNILYSAPLFITGGILYLYKDILKQFSSNYGMGVLIAFLLLFSLQFITPYLFKNIGKVIGMCLIYGIILIYAIGNSPKFFTNRVTKYIGDISLEIYLCHMVMFRGISLLHLETFIADKYLLYAVTCVLVLTAAVVFSHLIKYVVFPRLSALPLKKVMHA